jgi:hypothetical protein
MTLIFIRRGWTFQIQRRDRDKGYIDKLLLAMIHAILSHILYFYIAKDVVYIRRKIALPLCE